MITKSKLRALANAFDLDARPEIMAGIQVDLTGDYREEEGTQRRERTGEIVQMHAND